MPGRAVVAIRCRIRQPRFARERLRRDLIELELGLTGHAGLPRVPGQRRNGALHDRVAVGSRRGDHRARSVEDEGSAIRADGLPPQQLGEAGGALGIRLRRRRREVVVQLHADVFRPRVMELCRQPRRIVLPAPQRDDRGGGDQRERQCDERREDEHPDRQALLHRDRVSRCRATACFPAPFAVADCAFPDVPRDLRPEPPEPSGERQGDQEGHRSQEPGDRQREEQRREDVSVGDGGGELARADESPHHRVEQHDQRDEYGVPPPGPQPAEIGIPTDELVGHPHEGGPEEVALRPVQDKARRHPLDQIRQHVRRRHGDQRRIAEEHDAQQDHQVLQGLERLRALHEHDERSQVPGRDHQQRRQRHAQERLGIPRLPGAAEAPPIADPQREAAERAEGQQQADDIAEAPPHLEQWHGARPDDCLEPADDVGHDRS